MPDHHRDPVGQLTAAGLDRYASQLARCLKVLQTSAPHDPFGLNDFDAYPVIPRGGMTPAG